MAFSGANDIAQVAAVSCHLYRLVPMFGRPSGLGVSPWWGWKFFIAATNLAVQTMRFVHQLCRAAVEKVTFVHVYLHESARWP